ncbi:MAG: NADH-quinone oxidoreductase subunit NuoB [Candidatus Melainabacteria bacterium]|nr:NADH-quinone oxidoreductase subunit NuoB [Candidatus Melainabacteria bacterium]
MLRLLNHIFKTGCKSQKELFPNLPEYAQGLPCLNDSAQCKSGCDECVSVCPTNAIEHTDSKIKLDLGACINCSLCIETCPTGVIQKSLSTKTACVKREQLFLPEVSKIQEEPNQKGLFQKSLSVRVVSTGCSACDLEIGAAFNPIFDASRFGVNFVASPRMADALLVTGPCPKGMQDALLRTYEAMPGPKLVIACGTCAISGGVHKNGYADANGLESLLKIDVYIPGCPPHPWSIIHGLSTAMNLSGS